MRVTVIILASIVLGASACTDLSAPPSATETVAATASRHAVLDLSQSDAESMASSFDDASSRLLLSFPSGRPTTELREALDRAASAIRARDLTAASSAIENAQSALALVDSNESNPDATAIRLVLRYATSTATALVPETH